MPLSIAQPARSPTGSWLAAATSLSRVQSPTPIIAPQVNGTRVNSPIPDARQGRQDKKRISLSFFSKGGEAASVKSEKELKPEKNGIEDHLDAESTTTSNRSRSKDRSKNRLSLNFFTPTSPVPEALPHFPPQASNHSLGKIQSRDRSIDGRPQTSKSMKSDRSEHHTRTGSVKKRLSNFYLGKKSSKASVKGRVDDTLEEE